MLFLNVFTIFEICKCPGESMVLVFPSSAADLFSARTVYENTLTFHKDEFKGKKCSV